MTDIKTQVYLAHRQYMVDNKLSTIQDFNQEFIKPCYDHVYETTSAEFERYGTLDALINSVDSHDGLTREVLIYIQKKLQEQCPTTK